MGFIILCSILLLLSIIGIIISDKVDFDALNFSSWCILAMSAIALITLLLTLTTVSSDFKSYKIEYQTTKMLVDSYKGEEYGNVNALTEKIIYINDKIAEHKAYSKNFWVNIWYSEEVGNLEPITFK